jgi:ABC-2 type transport system permease protein
MLSTVARQTLHSQRRGLIGWAIGTALLVAMMGAFWPSVRDMPDLDKLLSNYPEAMRKLFDIQSITTGRGYLNTELFTMMLPALFVIFGVGRGARLLAGEEESGALEVVLTTPVSRRRLLLDKALAVAASVAALGVVLFAVTVATAFVADMGTGIGQIAAACTAMTLLGLEHAWLAMAVGAATGRRSVAIAAGSVVAVAGYMLFVLGRMVDAVAPWAVISPFHQALDGGPVGAGLPAVYLWLAAGAAAALIAGVPAFDRRDVRASH